VNELQTILADTVIRLFTDRVTQPVRESAEKGQWPAALWQMVEESGLTLPQIPEVHGGGGGTWQDARVVVSAAGRFAVPLPLAETMVAAWLLSETGLDVPPGPLTVAPVNPVDRLTLERGASGWALTGTASRIPWGRAARHVVVAVDSMIALIAAGATKVEPDVNLALEPRDTLTWEATPVVAAARANRLPPDALRLHGALVRSAQMAGGLEYLLAQTVRYVSERKQFGRPLGSFQAIQHQLALLAGQTAAAGIAAANAFRAADRRDAAFEIAVAKARTGEAAGLGAGIAHQCHGAIGFTYEHSLHFVTRRLWSWRAEFGAESHWAAEIGRAVADRGADALWPYLTGRAQHSDAGNGRND
jgi:acyl-CoA dehydrogenase